MRFVLRNLRHLRWRLLLFIMLVAAGAGAAVVARHLAALAEGGHRQALERRDGIMLHLARVNEEAADIRNKIGRYREMQARGHLGPERRLDWIERCAQFKERHLIDLRYELSPQKPLSWLDAASGSSHEFMASTMKLQMRLLHEGALLGFLADLAGSVPAFLRVRACNVERIYGAQPDGALLKVDCMIDWITLREVK